MILFQCGHNGRVSLHTFLAHLNGFHPNIQITMKMENVGLPFLDVFELWRGDGTGQKGILGAHTHRLTSADEFPSFSPQMGCAFQPIHRWFLILSVYPWNWITSIECLNKMVSNAMKMKTPWGSSQAGNRPVTESEVWGTVMFLYYGTLSARLGRPVKKADFKLVFHF